MKPSMKPVRSSVAAVALSLALLSCFKSSEQKHEPLIVDVATYKGATIIEAYLEWGVPDASMAAGEPLLIHVDARGGQELATIEVKPEHFPKTTAFPIEDVRASLGELLIAYQSTLERLKSAPERVRRTGCVYPIRARLFFEDGRQQDLIGCREPQGFGLSMSQWTARFLEAGYTQKTPTSDHRLRERVNSTAPEQ